MAKKILVLSGKGGVGKSTVCACLADGLKDKSKSVLLVDADVGFRSLDLIMRVGDSVVYNWLDVITGNCEAAEAPVNKENEVALLSAPSAFSDEITSESFNEMLGKYDIDYDYILIDAPAGSGELHKILAGSVDMLLLVVTPDPVCVRSAEVAIDRALEVKPSLETAMIINRFNKLEVMAGRQMKLDDVIDGTHTRLLGVIPESDSIRLIPSGEEPTKYAASAFERTAKRLLGENVKFRIKDFY